MNGKILNFLLVLTSLLGYLEWGGNNQSFLFQAEANVLFRLVTEPLTILHPFTILPLISQITLIYTLFQKKPGKALTFISMGGLGILLVLIFAIGLINLNYKTIISIVPFVVVSAFTIRHHRNHI